MQLSLTKLKTHLSHLRKETFQVLTTYHAQPQFKILSVVVLS